MQSRQALSKSWTAPLATEPPIAIYGAKAKYKKPSTDLTNKDGQDQNSTLSAETAPKVLNRHPRRRRRKQHNWWRPYATHTNEAQKKALAAGQARWNAASGKQRRNSLPPGYARHHRAH